MAWLLYALEEGGAADREHYRQEFFKRMGRPCLEDPIKALSLEPVEIPAGEFVMGSPADEEGRADEERHHEVTHSPFQLGERHHEVTLSPFQLGKYPVTEGQYRVFVEGEAEVGEASADDRRLPVVEMNWWEAWLYCRWIGGHLPTEAQWEYACRSGSSGRWCFGDDEVLLDEYAWYKHNSGNKRHPVGEKKANAWDLHDMHGSVWEWCSDWRGSYGGRFLQDPMGPRNGSDRVLRGGGFRHDVAGCRSAQRSGLLPGVRSGSLGFRVAFPAPEHFKNR